MKRFQFVYTVISVRCSMYFAIFVKSLIRLFLREPNRIQKAYLKIYNLHRFFTKYKRAFSQNGRFSLPKSFDSTCFYTSTPQTNSNVLILASGESTRWQKEGLKQLAIVHNKPLIEHILHKNKNALVVTHHNKLQKYPSVKPSRHHYVLETLLSTQTLWKKQTTILLGDVYFGEKDFAKIMSFKGKLAVFGSRQQVEIFALSFSEDLHTLIKTHLKNALIDAYEGGRGKLWEFYHSLVGLPLFRIGIGEDFIDLHNTTDIDTIEDYKNLLSGVQPKQYLKDHIVI